MDANDTVGTPRVFVNRAGGGAELARALKTRSLRPPATSARIPRGGVAVAVPVAKTLDAEFDVIVVRKVGTPGRPEFAIGATGLPNIGARAASVQS